MEEEEEEEEKEEEEGPHKLWGKGPPRAAEMDFTYTEKNGVGFGRSYKGEADEAVA